jgi:hypothetical protein
MKTMTGRLRAVGVGDETRPFKVDSLRPLPGLDALAHGGARLALLLSFQVVSDLEGMFEVTVGGQEAEARGWEKRPDAASAILRLPGPVTPEPAAGAP